MAKLVSVSTKGKVSVLKAFRDSAMAEVKAAGVTVGTSALTETVNGEFVLALATDEATGNVVYLNFGKPVVTAADVMAKRVKKEATPAEPKDAPVLPALNL